MPRRLGRALTGHDVSNVVQMGWSGFRNGRLIDRAMSAGFEVLLTADRNLPYQQNVPALGLALVVLAVPDKRMETLSRLVPDILAVLGRQPQPGTATIVGTWRVR